MSYASAHSLRTALEHRLLTTAAETGIGIDRLRRRVMFQRIVARLDSAEPGLWVLKGGMALEVHLHDAARLTKDIDLGLREPAIDPDQMHERLIDALAADADNDRFQFRAGKPRLLRNDGAGLPTWRSRIDARLAGRTFGAVSLDISPRPHELTVTEHLALPNARHFAEIPDRTIETIGIHRHAAEKLHALSRTYQDRENSRVRDLVDIALLSEHDLLDLAQVAAQARAVWSERETADPQAVPPALPASWPERYQRIADEHGLTTTFTEATALYEALWMALIRAR